jgi:hypothetical protein
MGGDVLGWRKKFAVLGPSTNTIVQPDFDDLRPAGVTNHYSRIFTPNTQAVCRRGLHPAGRDDVGGAAARGEVRAMQMQSPAQRSQLQHIQLMPQHQNLGFELLTRLEVVAQHADEQEADCNHAAIMF